MTRNKLESYQANKRLIGRNQKKIEEERCKDIPIVRGKVTGSSQDFPYIKQRYTVQMEEPAEAERTNKRIRRWQQEIRQAEEETEEVEEFVAAVENAKDREILTYRYIDGEKIAEVAKKVGYTKGRISQIITKYIKD